MDAQIAAYLEVIRADYRSWSNTSPADGETGARVRARMTEEFCTGLSVKEGSKFIKVIAGGNDQRTVHSFIVKQDMKTRDGKHFKRGDVLKAATWAAPAMNYARANIFDGNFMNIRWTGAM